MNKKLIFSIIVALIALAAVFAYIKYNKPEEISSNIDTSDWLTYRNELVKFEIKIPKDWGELSTYDGSWNKLDLTNVHDYITIGDKNNINSISLNILIDNKNFNSINDYISLYFNENDIVKEESIIVTGGFGKKITLFDNYSKKFSYHFIFWKSNNVIVAVRSFDLLGNKIASLFSFID